VNLEVHICSLFRSSNIYVLCLFIIFIIVIRPGSGVDLAMGPGIKSHGLTRENKKKYLMF